jgi:MoaA/NifB/PqqE/SkfB family radical SAM enzyme
MYMSRRLNRSFAPPDWLTVNLTLQCNLTCTMCTTCYDVPDELSTAEIKGLIDQAALWGVKVFNPLGGELFMRGDLEDILEHACRKDFYITVTTNATLLNRRRAETLARIPSEKLHLNISLDGPEGPNDSIRGEGMYRRALRGYQNLREADAAAGNRLRKVLVNTIIHRRNLAVLPSFLDELEGLGFTGVQLLNLFRHGPGGPEDTSGLWLRPQDMDELESVVAELTRRVQSQGGNGFRILNTVEDLGLIPSYYRDELKPLEAPCWSGWKELYINSNGDAIMCDGQLDFLAGRFGSARDNTLRELWDSEALRERREVVKQCSTPCIQNCYLRRESDSAVGIAKTAFSLLKEEVGRRTSRMRPARHTRVEGGHLRLELTDIAPWSAPWDEATGVRFDSFVAESPMDVSDCWEQPALWMEFRDKGYVDFGRGFLGFEVVERTVLDLRRAGLVFPTVELSWRGEPLLHPEFERILRFVLEEVREHGTFERVKVRTDGRLLSERLSALIGEFGEVPQTWELHGNGAEAVEDAVVAHVDELLARRGQATRVIAAWTVTEDLDPHYFVELWSSRLRDPAVRVGSTPTAGDAIVFRRVDHDHFQTTALARERLSELGELLDVPVELGPDNPLGCPGPFATPTVSWDAKLVLCASDTAMKARSGEVDKDSLARIWRDEVAGRRPHRGSLCSLCAEAAPKAG